MQPIEISAIIDLEDILDAIKNAKDLNDNDELFKRLAQIKKWNNEVKAVQDILTKVEIDVKGLINARAKALYGDEWSAIAGRGYKVTRSATGAVYEISGDVEEKYLKVKVGVDATEVKNYVKANSKLPDGISYNPERNDSIRITVNEDAA